MKKYVWYITAWGILTNQNQGGGKDPHGVQSELPLSFVLSTEFVEYIFIQLISEVFF